MSLLLASSFCIILASSKNISGKSVPFFKYSILVASCHAIFGSWTANVRVLLECMVSRDNAKKMSTDAKLSDLQNDHFRLLNFLYFNP